MFIVGLVSGVMLATAGTAFAAEEVRATFQRFMLVINGAEPVEIEPLVYRGTTYLPVRETANLLGYDVTYKADMRTIELSKPEPIKEPNETGKGVGDVNTIAEQEKPESSELEYIPLSELGSYGITVEFGSDSISLIYAAKTVTFASPDSDNISMAPGGYTIKREGDELYIDSISLQRILEGN